MSRPVTVEQIEGLAEQLRPQEQLKLVAMITDRLSKEPAIQAQTGQDDRANEYAAGVEAFLRMSDENAAECTGEVDSAVDIRQIREERASRL